MTYNGTNIALIENKIEMYCSRSEQCCFSVRKKLLSWCVPMFEITRILQNLVSEDFINERRYASAFVNDKIKFGHCGKQKIRYELLQHSIPENFIQEAFSRISDDTYREILFDVASAKFATITETDPFQKKRKLTAFLLSRGFEMNEIIDVEKLIK